MNEGKSKFGLLVVAVQLNNYVNDILPNFPKKEIILKQNIEKNEFQLIENIPLYEYNKGLPVGNLSSQILAVFWLILLFFMKIKSI